jgi:hypothetical protein
MGKHLWARIRHKTDVGRAVNKMDGSGWAVSLIGVGATIGLREARKLRGKYACACGVIVNGGLSGASGNLRRRGTGEALIHVREVPMVRMTDGVSNILQ